MPNHTHLIAVPETEEGLRLAIGEAHRRYSAMINREKREKGTDLFSSVDAGAGK